MRTDGYNILYMRACTYISNRKGNTYILYTYFVLSLAVSFSPFFCACHTFPRISHTHNDLPTIDNDLLIDPALGISPFQAFPRRNPRLIHIEIEEPDATMIAIIATIPAESSAPAVAHPQRRGLAVLPRRRQTIVVDMVVTTRHHHDALLHQRVFEVRVVRRRRRRFRPVAHPRQRVGIAVFGERDVDERQVHVDVRVLAVFALQRLRRRLEPLDLAGLEPVVAVVFLLLGRVAVRVEQVQRQRRVRGGAAAQDLDHVVADALDVFGTRSRQGIGQPVHNGHGLRPVQVPLIVVVAENARVRDLVPRKQLRVLVDGALSVRCRVAVDLVARQDDQVRLLVLEEALDKLERARIRLARLAFRQSVSAFPETGGQV